MGLEKIAELKKKLGITTEELSIRSGVPIGTLNKILNGTTKDPKLETLKAISKVLGCTLDDFNDVTDIQRYNFSEFENFKKLTDHEKRLLAYYYALTDLGKKKVMDNIEDLSKIYASDSTSELKAAHNDNAFDPEELKKINRDMDKLKRPE